jgi:hypothetical protein
MSVRPETCGWRQRAVFGCMRMAMVSASAFLGLNPSQLSAAAAPCRIEVVDKQNGWPVPLVELRTTHQVRLVTDNAGLIACDLPELMGRETWFNVIGHGYEVPKDGFGFRGVRLKPQPGQTLKVQVSRAIIAKRLGRLTGGGLFAESQKLGRELDWTESPVFGCDSVQNAPYRGKLYWIWGDTTIPRYPLGLFDTLGATSEAQPLQSFEPPLRFRFDYFSEANGKLRGVAKFPGEGPTWVTAMATLVDRASKPHLVCSGMKVRKNMEVYEWSLAQWDDRSEAFKPLRILWTKSSQAPKPPPLPQGHVVFWTDTAGKPWALFAHPFPSLRCPATFEGWQDSATWEPLSQQATLTAAGTGETITPHTGPHSGGLAWNTWRKRWVAVFMQAHGKPSAFGELWYAEADAPTGPWGKAVKVLSHDNYTFYNPRLHPELTPLNSSVLLFEGTYTTSFADRPPPTPRYDYNQILYRLDLDDPALAPAREPAGLPAP